MDGIIFDVDGTMWDSTEIIARAWTDVVRTQEHLDLTITPQKLRSLFGRLLPDIARQLFPDFSEAEQLRIIELCCQAEHEALLKECAPLYEDLEVLLQTLSREYPLFIVSNCQAGYIEVFLKSTGFGHYFKDHLCPGDTGMAKAENIQEIIRRHSLSAPVYIGDTMGDYEACQTVGVPFVFAAYGFGNVPQAAFRLEKPLDFLALCKNSRL